jgi:hypothetical protein
MYIYVHGHVYDLVYREGNISRRIYGYNLRTLSFWYTCIQTMYVCMYVHIYIHIHKYITCIFTRRIHRNCCLNMLHMAKEYIYICICIYICIGCTMESTNAPWSLEMCCLLPILAWRRWWLRIWGGELGDSTFRFPWIFFYENIGTYGNIMGT